MTLASLAVTLAVSPGCNDDGGGGGGASGPFAAQIATFKALYGKSDAWESWMLANASRYQAAFNASSSMPAVLTISFRYESAPIIYSPPWTDEAEHMSVFATMAQGAYPGYPFDFVFGADPNTSYANVIAGTAGTTSYALGNDVYLYYETIFNHEFGHVMRLPHHYDTIAEVGLGLHMPPGDTQCIMDRTWTLFCSACRTALGIPLDVNDTTAMDAAMTDILSRYPY